VSEEGRRVDDGAVKSENDLLRIATKIGRARPAHRGGSTTPGETIMNEDNDREPLPDVPSGPAHHLAFEKG
jgi:hypothetical protein